VCVFLYSVYVCSHSVHHHIYTPRVMRVCVCVCVCVCFGVDLCVCVCVRCATRAANDDYEQSLINKLNTAQVSDECVYVCVCVCGFSRDLCVYVWVVSEFVCVGVLASL